MHTYKPYSIHIYMYVCMYICICMCMYIYIHIHVITIYIYMHNRPRSGVTGRYWPLEVAMGTNFTDTSR